MIDSRRTVLVCERLRQGISIDTAMELIASTTGEVVVSIALLDRPSGTRSVAVSVVSEPGHDAKTVDRIRNVLAPLFEEVSTVAASLESLARGHRLT